ncbi:MAG TPA: hypothetical protein VK464_14190 [Symbiobacteriaceae bacterium]|nr:hypothetical protein [Symbiobacteriaceae bacterium]
MSDNVKAMKAIADEFFAKAAAGSPFPGLTFAGELDDLEDLEFEVTMTERWLGYLNLRVVQELNRLHPGRISHLRFLPDTAEGVVIIIPAGEKEYGACELGYSDTENAATVNLRRAVKRFKLEKKAGRVRVFPVIEKNAPNGDKFLAFIVKNTETRPAKRNAKASATVAVAQETGEEQE